MPTKLERRLAEQILGSNHEQPAHELILNGLLSYYGLRSKLLDTIEPALTQRNRIVRCKLKRGAQLVIHVGAYCEQWTERVVTEDPDTGLTHVHNEPRERKYPYRVVAVKNRVGSVEHYRDMRMAAHDLASRCRGDTQVVDRVCGAIERARKRVLALAEQTTRWL
jgi:hypothetical protein